MTIAAINDRFRQGDYTLGTIVYSPRVLIMTDEARNHLLQAIAFYNFPINTPYPDHDFGAIALNSELYFWKIHIEDTKPVMQVMIYEEY